MINIVCLIQAISDKSGTAVEYHSEGDYSINRERIKFSNTVLHLNETTLLRVT